MSDTTGHKTAGQKGEKRKPEKRKPEKRKPGKRTRGPGGRERETSRWDRPRRAAAVFGPLFAMGVVISAARETGGHRLIYVADTITASLVRLWLAQSAVQNLRDGAQRKPHVAGWLKTTPSTRGGRATAFAWRFTTGFVITTAAIVAAREVLRVPLSLSGCGVVGVAIAALTTAVEVAGWWVSKRRKSTRRLVRMAGLGLGVSLVLLWVVTAVMRGMLHEPMRALSLLVAGSAWQAFLPASWTLGIVEGLADGSPWLVDLAATCAVGVSAACIYVLRFTGRNSLSRWHTLPPRRRRGWLAGMALTALAGASSLAVRCDTPWIDATSTDTTWTFGQLQPGAPGYDEALITKLEAAWNAREAGYEPRTRHLRPNGDPKFTNRLFLESSPYLRQHAHNPVNWFPWGEEAFALAKQLGRPVLLSVGYSTCHWCHVMEEESFEDEEIARYINTHYIAVKVDREERPDVDSIYMAAVRMFSGGGGWPMTVWLTAERKPFFGGTYYPARDGDRGAGTGFLTLLKRLRQMFDERGDKVAESSEEAVRKIRERLTRSHGQRLPRGAALASAVRGYEAQFDETHGGLDRAPKFPSSLPIRLLLRYDRRAKHERARAMADKTLRQMAAGGMYDHVGGGFHRYSTDKRWLVPHFEKMLYDNALLCMAYLDGYQVLGDEELARVAREIMRYVARDMTSPDGAFYSATDADSLTPDGHRDEGYFFTWTLAELDEALGAQTAKTVARFYGASTLGNFESRNILHMPVPAKQLARELGRDVAELWRDIDAARDVLFRVRAKRPHPLRDDKILAAWNGLMISAHARAAMVLNEPSYAERAATAASFVLEHLQRDGRLLRSYRAGAPADARRAGFLDDYAFVIAGLLDLHEATGATHWLREAIRLSDVLHMHYADARGGYFMTSDDHESLLAREKPSRDGAEPSGNSVQAMNLLRLYELTDAQRFRKRATATLSAFGGLLTSRPAAMSEMMLALDFHLDAAKQIIILTPSSRTEAAALLDVVRTSYVPNRVLVVATEGDDQAQQEKLIPLLKKKIAKDGLTTAYVCERQVCELPTHDPKVLRAQLAKVRAY